MNEANDYLNSLSVAGGCAAAAVIICALLARSRGYSAVFYGSLGLFLSFGAIPLTFLATRGRLPEEEPPEMGFTPSDSSQRDTADPDLASWRHLYNAIRDSLVLGSVAAIMMAVLALSYVVTSILPTFVALFEGLSLALPLPTQAMIGLTKFFRNPEAAPIFWLTRLIWPAALFFFLSRSGYRFPLLGGVWKAADQLWLLQTRRLYGRQWREHVPVETLGRMPAADESGSPCTEEQYQALLRRQREALQTALWRLIPGLIPTLGVVVVLVWLVGVSLFLPLYQIVGNIGG